MRDLVENEIAVVSGAGTVETTKTAQERGESIGKSIGGFIDGATKIFNFTTDFTAAFTLMGSAIGSIVDSDYSVGIKNLLSSLGLLLNAFSKKPETPAVPETPAA